MDHGVLDQRLQEQRRDLFLQGLIAAVALHTQTRAEAHLFNGKIALQHRELFADRYSLSGAQSQGIAQEVGQQ